jgi:hypothetical protein
MAASKRSDDDDDWETEELLQSTSASREDLTGGQASNLSRVNEGSHDAVGEINSKV